MQQTVLRGKTLIHQVHQVHLVIPIILVALRLQPIPHRFLPRFQIVRRRSHNAKTLLLVRASNQQTKGSSFLLFIPQQETYARFRFGESDRSECVAFRCVPLHIWKKGRTSCLQSTNSWNGKEQRVGDNPIVKVSSYSKKGYALWNRVLGTNALFNANSFRFRSMSSWRETMLCGSEHLQIHTTM